MHILTLGVSLHPNGATCLRINGATQTAVFTLSDRVIIDPFKRYLQVTRVIFRFVLLAVATPGSWVPPMPFDMRDDADDQALQRRVVYLEKHHPTR